MVTLCETLPLRDQKQNQRRETYLGFDLC